KSAREPKRAMDMTDSLLERALGARAQSGRTPRNAADGVGADSVRSSPSTVPGLRDPHHSQGGPVFFHRSHKKGVLPRGRNGGAPDVRAEARIRGRRAARSTP